MEEKILQKIGSRIRDRRQILKISQKELADMCDLCSMSICAIENGRTSMNIDTFLKICEALSANPTYIIYGAEINSEPHHNDNSIDTCAMFKNIGSRVRRQRGDLGISQEKLAKSIKTTQPIISIIETGTYIDHIMDLCQTFDMDPNYLIFGSSRRSEAVRLMEKISALSAEDQKLVEMVVDKLLGK